MLLNESGRKPNKRWVDKCSKFYNRSMSSSLEDNGTEMHSTHNEEKRLIRTAKNKIYKYMTPLSKNLYIDKLAGNEYNSAINMKPVDVKSSTYIDFNLKNLDKDLNLELVIM